uniref:Uncharacterized protein n=1 Tax=Arundo donax TaxID=35708 RepID=A0A0A9AU89_ARUDO
MQNAVTPELVNDSETDGWAS